MESLGGDHGVATGRVQDWDCFVIFIRTIKTLQLVQQDTEDRVPYLDKLVSVKIENSVGGDGENGPIAGDSEGKDV